MASHCRKFGLPRKANSMIWNPWQGSPSPTQVELDGKTKNHPRLGCSVASRATHWGFPGHATLPIESCGWASEYHTDPTWLCRSFRSAVGRVQAMWSTLAPPRLQSRLKNYYVLTYHDS